MNRFRYKKEINGKVYESTLYVTNNPISMPYSRIQWESRSGAHTVVELDSNKNQVSKDLEDAAMEGIAADALNDVQEMDSATQNEDSQQR